MNEEANLSHVLNQMSVDDSENIFFIGKCASRLTFISQQYRALNLIWALQKRKKINSNTKIIVVGAGLGGLTAAYASYHLGASVTLFESKTDALHMQRGCQLRFIHPYILDWPKEDSETKAFTNLPCLNWGAGMADQVCDSILTQWDSIKNSKRVECKYGFEVREIKNTTKNKPNVLAEGSNETYRSDCDILILAVGFGLEKPISSVPFYSYWENDNFGRPVITGKVPRTYLVTGCGDGGLIDVIRLRINNFKHDSFIYDLNKNGIELKEIKDILLNIDRDMPGLLEKKDIKKRIINEIEMIKIDPYISNFFEDSDAVERFAKKCIESELFEESYNKIDIPKQLIEDLLMLRKDTVVYLNSPYPSPYTSNSSILNRFIVFLLRKHGNLRYRHGWVEISKGNIAQSYNALFKSYKYPVENLEVNEVVARHGPISRIDKLFDKNKAKTFHPPIVYTEDITATPLYDKSFLNIPALIREREKIKLDYAMSRLPEVAVGKFKREYNYSRYGIHIKENEPTYFILIEDKSTIEQDITNFYEFKVIVENNEEYKKSRSIENGEIAPVEVPKSDSGCSVYWIEDLQKVKKTSNPTMKTLATVCCFVESLSNKNQGFLSVTNLLTTPQNLRLGDRLGIINQKRSALREKTAIVTSLKIATPSNSQANLVSDTVRLNRYDAVIAEFESNNNIDYNYLGYSDSSQPSSLFDKFEENDINSLVKKKIFKIGVETGLTYGIIEEVYVTDKIHRNGEQYWYDRLIRIVGEREGIFAKHGDEGSAIVDEGGVLIGMLLDCLGNEALACFIHPILSELKYKVVFKK